MKMYKIESSNHRAQNLMCHRITELLPKLSCLLKLKLSHQVVTKNTNRGE